MPGYSDEHDSYRSKLAGLYGIVRMTRLLMDIGGLNKAGIEIGCDGLSALERSFDLDFRKVSSKQAHFDLISGIHGMMRDSGITCHTRHIKGHQDEVKGAILDRWAVLNVECDLRAKTYLHEIISGYKRSQHTINQGM